MKRARVIVAGAGPVGTVAAYRLAQAGIDVVVLEALASCPEDMRASTLHAPTLDMMEELGVLDMLEAQGLRAPVYQYRNRRSGHIVELDLGEIADASRHPYRLQCEQYKLSRLLAARLIDHPHAEMLFQRRLLHIEQDASGVVVHVEAPFEIETYRADYLIGADGANSTVRKWLDVEFEGFTYPERFLTLSTAYPIEHHLDRLSMVNYVADPDEWCVLLRVPELWRVLVPARDASDAELLSDAKKGQVFEGLIGNGNEVETYHRTVYRVHQRVAKQFRKGRVALAGDAAHLNNPLGGFGMNSGIHDAWNLTAKLRDILLEGADPERLLDRYDRQRRTVTVEFVQAQTIANKQTLESGGDGGTPEMERRMNALLRDSAQRRAYLLKQAMYASLAREAEID
jgi:3-(3-hydroxy-phenyl)propionate hydroxylase